MRSLSTPGVSGGIDDTEQKEELEGEMVTKYRALGARCNYLSMDRPDLAFATKEFCRKMAAPTSLDWSCLLRIVKHLKGEPRLVYHCVWQDECPISVYFDTDFAGCSITRRSTSGGRALRG